MSKKPWYDLLGGKRFVALLFGLIVFNYCVLVVAWLSTMALAWEAVKFVCGFTLVGIISYITGRTITNIKNGMNGDTLDPPTPEK